MDSYLHHKELIDTNRMGLQKYEQLIDQSIEAQDDPPVNAWDALAAETQEQYECENDGVEVDPDHAVLYPENITQGQVRLPEPSGSTQCALAIDTVPTVLPFADYSSGVLPTNRQSRSQILCTFLYREVQGRVSPI